MSFSILVAGDVVPSNRTIPLFENNKSSELFGEIRSYINADLNVVNLEAPISNGAETPIQKTGPSLKSSFEAMATLKSAGFNLITLANNHFRDQGQQGVEDTIKSAIKLNLKYVGGGRSLKEARSISYHKINDSMIAIINACEHEHSIATKQYGGSNPMDVINMYQDIAEARKKADFVLIITHGGVEHYQYPTPRMKKLFHHLIDIGADAVINHHQHCLSGYEIYNGKPIFYGLGNFNFDSYSLRHNKSLWCYGYMVKLCFDNDDIRYDLIPYVQNAVEPTMQLRDSSDFQNEILAINQVVADDDKLEKYYKLYVAKKEKEILLDFLPSSNRYVKALFRRDIFSFYKKSHLLNILDRVECESLRDEALTMLKDKILN